MNRVLSEIAERTNLNEGPNVAEQFLIKLYFNEQIPINDLAREIFMPVPVVVAMKNEYKKLDFVSTIGGLRLTETGKRFICNELGFEGLDESLYLQLMALDRLDDNELEIMFEDALDELTEIFMDRPNADTTLDQCKCLPITALKRAVLAIQTANIFNKDVLCIGDDDFISVAVCVLLKHLFKQKRIPVRITVVEKDERIVASLQGFSQQAKLPIKCVQHDLKQPLSDRLEATHDLMFTDPPYTVDGCRLFITRGLYMLEKTGVNLLLSFGQKPPLDLLKLQTMFSEFGLIIKSLYRSFNRYEGSQITGSVSNMYVLGTTEETKKVQTKEYQKELRDAALYTGEARVTVRKYTCIRCNKVYGVGKNEAFMNIEHLKASHCPHCGGDRFLLVDRKNV